MNFLKLSSGLPDGPKGFTNAKIYEQHPEEYYKKTRQELNLPEPDSIIQDLHKDQQQQH